MTNSPETTDTNQYRIFSDQTNQTCTVPLLLQAYATTPAPEKPSAAVADELGRFQISLKWCLLDHSSAGGRLVSYTAFALLAVIVPAIAAFSVRDDDAGAADPVHFNKLVQLPLSGLSAVAFVALSGGRLRRLLLLLELDYADASLRRRHAAVLDRAFRRLSLILLPSLLAELAHKLVFFSSVAVAAPYGVVFPLNSVLFVLVMASWVYRSGVFLLVCAMFRLTCELQILRFEGFQKMFEESETTSCGAIFREHVRIKKQLGVTSHSYRFFIIWSLFIITVTQFGALLLVLGSKTEKNFLNSGDLVVCSCVEISGFFLCLVGATRITHRAQRLVSVATRWHMLVTCASSESSDEPNQSKAQIDYDHDHDHDHGQTDDSDRSEHLISVTPQDPFSFQTRQALVAYLQHNGGGITLFGFALDRGLLHTLFAFEFSLVLWILSKVVVLS